MHHIRAFFTLVICGIAISAIVWAGQPTVAIPQTFSLTLTADRWNAIAAVTNVSPSALMQTHANVFGDQCLAQCRLNRLQARGIPVDMGAASALSETQVAAFEAASGPATATPVSITILGK